MRQHKAAATGSECLRLSVAPWSGRFASTSRCKLYGIQNVRELQELHTVGTSRHGSDGNEAANAASRVRTRREVLQKDRDTQTPSRLLFEDTRTPYGDSFMAPSAVKFTPANQKAERYAQCSVLLSHFSAASLSRQECAHAVASGSAWAVKPTLLRSRQNGPVRSKVVPRPRIRATLSPHTGKWRPITLVLSRARGSGCWLQAVRSTARLAYRVNFDYFPVTP